MILRTRLNDLKWVLIRENGSLSSYLGVPPTPTELVHLIASEANEISTKNQKPTITGQTILDALEVW